MSFTSPPVSLTPSRPFTPLPEITDDLLKYKHLFVDTKEAKDSKEFQNALTSQLSTQTEPFAAGTVAKLWNRYYGDYLGKVVPDRQWVKITTPDQLLTLSRTFDDKNIYIVCEHYSFYPSWQSAAPTIIPTSHSIGYLRVVHPKYQPQEDGSLLTIGDPMQTAYQHKMGTFDDSKAHDNSHHTIGEKFCKLKEFPVNWQANDVGEFNTVWVARNISTPKFPWGGY